MLQLVIFSESFDCSDDLNSSSKHDRNSDGFTALHYAAYHGQEMVVFLLLEAGAGDHSPQRDSKKVLNAFQCQTIFIVIAAELT